MAKKKIERMTVDAARTKWNEFSEWFSEHPEYPNHRIMPIIDGVFERLEDALSALIMIESFVSVDNDIEIEP